MKLPKSFFFFSKLFFRRRRASASARFGNVARRGWTRGNQNEVGWHEASARSPEIQGSWVSSPAGNDEKPAISQNCLNHFWNNVMTDAFNILMKFYSNFRLHVIPSLATNNVRGTRTPGHPSLCFSFLHLKFISGQSETLVSGKRTPVVARTPRNRRTTSSSWPTSILEIPSFSHRRRQLEP